MFPIELSTTPAELVEADALVLGVSADGAVSFGSTNFQAILEPKLSQLRQAGDFEGKFLEMVTLYDVPGLKSRRLLLVGLGKVKQLSEIRIMRAASAASKLLAGKQRNSVAFAGFDHAGLPFDDVTLACNVAAGAISGSHGQDLYQTKKTRFPFAKVILVTTAECSPAVEKGLKRGKVVGESMVFARTLVNKPPADLYPESFCDEVIAKAEKVGVETTVLGAAQLAAERCNCILAVGQASRRPPRMLVLRYEGAGPTGEWLGLVGKGVTFDSGGLSIKNADQMGDMKCDMAGAATVTSALIALAELKVPLNIYAVAPLAENMPGGSAYRPGDVLRARNGKTIEILNTDAEGRLILADALSYTVDLGVKRIVDLATLTGACMVALGPQVAGAMSNNDSWLETVISASRGVGELIWPLPMYEEYDDLIKSGIGDMKNTGGRYGGAITAAKLLAHFVGEVPWVHVDIAGPAFTEKDSAHLDGGGTGYFVRSLIALAEKLAAKS